MTRDELLAREEMWEGRVVAAQSAWQTPQSVLHLVVTRALGTPPTSTARVHSGTSNETYFCDTATTRVVVRVARVGRPYFEQERWAINAARAVGVSAPDVLFVAHEEIDGDVVSFCIEEFVSGLPLGKLARRRGREEGLVGAALRGAGEVLGAIHSVSTNGFGAPDGRGIAVLPDRPSYLDERMGPVPSGQPQEVIRALAVLGEHRGFLADVEPRLLHFDFEPAHLLVDETSGRISGLVDWESVKFGDPAYDLAQWDVIHDVYAPVGPLFEIYATSTDLPGDFDKRRMLSEIHYRAREIVHGLVPAGFIDDARSRLAAAVAQLGT